MSKGNGYEYEAVGWCPRTGKPIVAPIAWNSRIKSRPYYPNCMCYPACQTPKHKKKK